MLWLAPDPDDPFRAVTAAVQDVFPRYLPYGGAHDDVVAHLTVGERRFGTVADLEAAGADVRRGLPVHADVDEVLLVVGADAPDSWGLRHRFALA